MQQGTPRDIAPLAVKLSARFLRLSRYANFSADQKAVLFDLLSDSSLLVSVPPSLVISELVAFRVVKQITRSHGNLILTLGDNFFEGVW